MTQKKVYDREFKILPIKLGSEIGFSTDELGVNVDTLYVGTRWQKTPGSHKVGAKTQTVKKGTHQRNRAFKRRK